MADYASSIRKATLEANRLHRDLAIQAKVVRGPGRVDVYDTIARLGVPLMFTKLDGLLGAYYREPSPGVLITTQRPQSQQRRGEAIMLVAYQPDGTRIEASAAGRRDCCSCPECHAALQEAEVRRLGSMVIASCPSACIVAAPRCIRAAGLTPALLEDN